MLAPSSPSSSTALAGLAALVASFALALFAQPVSAIPAAVEVATPTFASGSLTDLRVAVIEVKGVSEYRNLLTVEVMNMGAVAAEPLVFRIDRTAKGGTGAKKGAATPITTRFARADLPHYQRYGRSTPAHGKQRYVLATAQLGKKSDYTVTVESASFVAAGTVEAPALEVSAPKQIQVSTFQGTIPVTEVTLENPLAVPVDALFLVTFTQPQNTVDLLGVTLPAHSTYRWQINSLAGQGMFPTTSDLPGVAVQATRFQLVDWSLAFPASQESGRTLLEHAYRGWLRWPDPQPTVSGDFSFHCRKQRLNSATEYDSFEIGGRFTLGEKNDVVIEIRSGGGVNPSLILESAFKSLRRESFDQVVAENVLVPIAEDRVEVRGPGFGSDRRDGRQLQSADPQAAGDSNWYRVMGDRIVGSGSGADLSTDADFELRWETTPFGDGYVIHTLKNRSTAFTCAYSQVDGWVMPVHATLTTQFGEAPYSVEEIAFTNLTTSGSDRIQRPAPRGPGVEELRSIWNATYRLTTEPIAMRARFEVTTPGTDWVWHGLKNLKGSVALRGIGRSMREIQVDFDGIDSREVEMSLAGAVADRLLMWYSRDPNDREDFDTMFAGCTIAAKDADDSFAVEGRGLARVLTREGRYVGLVHTGGGKTVFRYQKAGEHMVCTKVVADVGAGPEAWTETATFTFAALGEHLVPSTLKFENVFGKDWGPETIVFKELTAR